MPPIDVRYRKSYAGGLGGPSDHNQDLLGNGLGGLYNDIFRQTMHCRDKVFNDRYKEEIKRVKEAILNKSVGSNEEGSLDVEGAKPRLETSLGVTSPAKFNKQSSKYFTLIPPYSSKEYGEKMHKDNMRDGMELNRTILDSKSPFKLQRDVSKMQRLAK